MYDQVHGNTGGAGSGGSSGGIGGAGAIYEEYEDEPQPGSSSRDSMSRLKELCCSCLICKQCVYLLWRCCCFCFSRSDSTNSSTATTPTTRTIRFWSRNKKKQRRRQDGRLEDETACILQQPTDGESSVEDEVGGQPRHGSTGSISVGSSGFGGSGRISGGLSSTMGLGSDLHLEARRRASSLTNRKDSQYLVDYKSIDYWSGSINSLRSPGDVLVQMPQPSARRDTIGSSGIGVAQATQQLLLLKPELYNESSGAVAGVLGQESTNVDCTLGSIHFYLHYDITTKLLVIRIIEAKDLPRPIVHDSTKQDQSHSNPYVKICLLPNQKDSRQTTLRKKTQNPVFNEQFTFELTLHELERRTLSLTVKDFDKYSRHRVVGQVILPFHHNNTTHSSMTAVVNTTGASPSTKHISSTPSPTTSTAAAIVAAAAGASTALIPSEELMTRILSGGLELWRPLESVHSSTVHEDLGELLFSLCYLPGAGRLNIDILRAKQLLPTDLVGGAAPYVRVILLINSRPTKTKKTTYKKYTLDPVFNESLSFDINSVQLQDASIVMTVLDFNGGVAKDTIVGRIVLGKESSGPNEVNHWKNMIQSQRTPVAQWHSLKSQSYCDEMCSASRVVSNSK